MNHFVTWVKGHPILSSIFFVLFLIVLYILLKGGGGGGNTTTSTGKSAAELSAQVQEDSISAALQAKQLETSAQLQAVQAQTAAQVTAQAGTLAAQLQLAQINADTEKAKITADTSITAATLTAQQNIATIQANVTSSQIQAQADVIEAQTQAARDTQLATIGYFTTRDTGAQTIELAGIQAQRDVALQELANQNVVYTAATNAATARKAESTGWSQVIAALFKTGAPPADSYAGTGGFSFGIPGVVSVGYKG